ncbi:hypothetical protein CEE44_04080 [Candidatus Woesearchaeota archaeon B3_Woes]|nr:MAG: hypothetical protein CEE44_04080 [Candidatus Woesearchaeota archaeon B3_Woes]
MISIEAQQKLLLNISRRLKKPITAYAIGGTAMMFLGFKDSTLDIDLVFENKQDREIFEKAVKEIGYREMDSVIVYGTKQNQPKMFTLGDERLDLFVMHVIDFDFSKKMMERAEQTHQFNNNLLLKIANPHDLILMKCATDRKKDIDDARRMINSTKIDWNILINEAKTQIRLGRHTAAFDLGEFLEKLKYKMKINIPKEVLDDLFEIVKEQAEDKQKKQT